MREVILVTGEWCTVCKVMVSFWPNLALAGLQTDIDFKVMDVASLPEHLHGICSLPTTLFLEDGQLLLDVVGVQTQAHIVETVKQLWL